MPKVIKNHQGFLREYGYLILIYVIVASYLVFLSVEPFFAERYFREGYFSYQKRQVKSAVLDLEKAVDLAAWEPYYGMHLGKAYELLGDLERDTRKKLDAYTKATNTFKQIISLDNHNPWYKNRLAYLSLKLSQLVPEEAETYRNEAENYSFQAVTVDDQNPLFQMAHAQILFQLGKIDESIQYFETAQKMDPRIAEASFNLGNIYKSKNQINKAITSFETVYTHNPTFNKVPQILSQLYLLTNQPQKVIEVLGDTIKGQGGFDYDTRYLLGIAYFQLKDFPSAETHLERALQLKPDSAATVLMLGQTYVSLSKKNKAKNIYRRFLETSPDSQAVQNALRTLQ